VTANPRPASYLANRRRIARNMIEALAYLIQVARSARMTTVVLKLSQARSELRAVLGEPIAGADDKSEPQKKAVTGQPT
jgi:hypothetical protein